VTAELVEVRVRVPSGGGLLIFADGSIDTVTKDQARGLGVCTGVRRNGRTVMVTLDYAGDAVGPIGGFAVFIENMYMTKPKRVRRTATHEKGRSRKVR
jgi:hypothetical protein